MLRGISRVLCYRNKPPGDIRNGNAGAHEIRGNENNEATPSTSTSIMTYKFDPIADVADLTGKVAIVTGGK